MTAIRFWAYCRTSTEDLQSPEDSKRWQLARCAALVAGQGEIVGYSHDVGQSRSLPWKRRPEAAALLAECATKNRRFDAIVVAEPARAFAGGEFGLVFPVLTHHGVALWLPEVGGRVDPDSDAHDMMMVMFGSMSKAERARIKMRTRSALEAMAAVGRFTAGCVAYGYQLEDAGPHPHHVKAKEGKRLRSVVADPVAAPVVAELFERYAAGDGLGIIATDLSERGILSPSAHRPDGDDRDPRREDHERGRREDHDEAVLPKAGLSQHYPRWVGCHRTTRSEADKCLAEGPLPA